MLSVVTLSVIMLSVVMLSVVMLSVVMLSFIMLGIVMLKVIMLSVIMLSVVAPMKQLRLGNVSIFAGCSLLPMTRHWRHVIQHNDTHHIGLICDTKHERHSV
jgi:hypothetical protein